MPCVAIAGIGTEWRVGEGRGEVSLLYLISAALAVLLLGYLVVALILPEKFS